MDNENGSSTSSKMLTFNIRKQIAGARVGQISCARRPTITTPALVASTSRGAIPHVTPDVVQKHTSVLATYVGLEDFLEKSRQNAPIFDLPQDSAVDESRLRKYTALPNQSLSILGPRRVPGLSTPQQNTNSAIAISTSFGFANLEVEDYNNAVRNLSPDISVTAVDLVQQDTTSRKRLEKSTDRTHAWLRDTLDEAEKLGANIPIFASIPPLEAERQQFYLSDLADEFKDHLSGVCIYDQATTVVVPDSLNELPILCLSNPRGPHDLLQAISLGVDMITVPFVTDMSEAGIAFTFNFITSADIENQPIGIDMWSAEHAVNTSPLMPSCTCYACTRHHRAYVHHLLQAKEMLAWTLLQIHNFHVVDQFFQHVRESILNESLDEDSKNFRRAYESDLPQKTGAGPRIRGYQMRSIGRGEPKKNSKAYNKLEEQARKIEEAESGVATPAADADVEMLEAQGLGQQVGTM